MVQNVLIPSFSAKQNIPIIALYVRIINNMCFDLFNPVSTSASLVFC